MNAGWTPQDDAELFALVVQAFQLRGSPYFIDACAAIADWHDRRQLAALDRRQKLNARLIELLRETAPERIASRAAA